MTAKFLNLAFKNDKLKTKYKNSALCLTEKSASFYTLHFIHKTVVPSHKKTELMKLEIPFDDKIYTKQTSLNFDLTWKNNLSQHRYRLLLGIFMILVGIFMINGEKYFGYCLIGFGIHYLTNFIDNFLNYRKSKKKYNRLVKSEITGQINSKENSIWEFNEGDFYYKDFKFETKLKWFIFTGYRIIESNLFLDIDVGPILSYIISEDEIGKEKFEKVTEFVKKKIE